MRGLPGLSVDNTSYEDPLPTNNSSLSDSDECTPSCSLPNKFICCVGLSIIFRKDRSSKGGGEVLGFVNEDLIVKRRTDLEEVRLKHFVGCVSF